MKHSVKKIYIRLISGDKTLDQVEERSMSTMVASYPGVAMDRYGIIIARSIVSETIYEREKAILRFIIRYRSDG